MANSLVNTENLGMVPGVTQSEFDAHKHSAADITSGTLNSERLPVVPISKGGTGTNTIEGAREVLNAAGKWEKIWENTSPDYNFEAQPVNISSEAATDDMAMFMVVYRSDQSGVYGRSNLWTTQLLVMMTSEQENTSSIVVSETSAGGGFVYYRGLKVTWTSEMKQFQFSQAYRGSITAFSPTANNAVLKPIAIFGATI